MKLLMDENMPREAADLLRNLGHDVKSIQDLNLQGTTSGDIYRLIQAEERILVTLNLDFANILRHFKENNTSNCSRQIGKSDGCGLDLPIQTEQADDFILCKIINLSIC